MKSSSLNWAAALGAAFLFFILLVSLMVASAGGAAAQRALFAVGVTIVIIAVLIAVLAPPSVRLAVLRRRFPDSFVRNVRRTAGLQSAFEERLPSRPTLVATAASIELFGGWIRPALIVHIRWSEVDHLELGRAREYYLTHSALVVALKDLRRLPLPIDERLLAVGDDRVRVLAHQLAAIGKLRLDLSPAPGVASGLS